MGEIKVNTGRKISLENAEVIGHGFNSDVYRIDNETVVKVLKTQTEESAEHEIMLSKWALKKGIPTAISYDVVDIDGHPGLVYEFLCKGNLGKWMTAHPEDFDWCMQEYAKLLHDIHSAKDEEAWLPDAKDYYKEKLEGLACITEQERTRMRMLLDSIPHTDHIVHRDCHIKNIRVVDNGLMLIDLETLSRGDPIFDLMAVYCTYRLFNVAHGYTETDLFLNVSIEFEDKMLDSLYHNYFAGLSEADISENIKKIEMLSYLHMLIFIQRTSGTENYDLPKMLGLFRKRLQETEDLKLKY